MTNQQVAGLLTEIADLLEISSANAFRVRSYREAARAIEFHTSPLAAQEGTGHIQAIRGVGASIAGKVREMIDSGTCQYLEELRAQLPPTLPELLKVPGLGPKKVAVLHKHLHVASLEDLQGALERGEIRQLPGFGAKTEENLRRSLALVTAGTARHLLSEALTVAQDIMSRLEGPNKASRLAYAGSLRRGRDTIGDVDILATSAHPDTVFDLFCSYQGAEVLARGETKATIRTPAALQVDLRVVSEESFGAALQYFTGSVSHNVRLRKMAGEQGLKINEYGVFRGEAPQPVASREEEDVYRAVGLPWIAPVLREDTGEFEAALAGTLPRLIAMGDMKCDLHLHTDASDGSMTIAQAAKTAAKLGYEYICVSDHTKALNVANGLDEKRLLAQKKEVQAFNRKGGPLKVLMGCEVNILSDGQPDIASDVLAQMEFVVGSIHTGLGQSREKITARLLAAANNPHIDCIGHPSNRVIGRRAESELDWEALIAACAKQRCLIEINGGPERRDLDEVHARQAAKAGVLIAINSDAHQPEHLAAHMQYGLLTAQRGWLEASHVANACKWGDLRKRLKR